MHFRTVEPTDAHTDGMKHALTLHLPFPDHAAAATLQKALSVDKELKPSQVRKVFHLAPPNDDGGDTQAVLRVDIFATTVRQLRLSANAFLDDAALVCRTMSMFDPTSPTAVTSLEPQLRQQAHTLPHEDQLEQGSVGLAG